MKVSSLAKDLSALNFHHLLSMMSVCTTLINHMINMSVSEKNLEDSNI
ncbi:hypothetical protein NTGM5_130027 [Candidatus Nitrotoga sp. M5]|nr:hypothetical protein NTGM5_130027 [Candidatus Nitrotoga sp. M5]